MSAVLSTALYHIERIDGQEIEKPTPKKLHAFLMSTLLRELFRLQLDWLILPEMDVLIGNGDWLVPDIVLVRPGALYQNDMLAEAPALAVEILSPGQTIGNLFDKCERLHRVGTETCWVLWPEKQRAWIFAAWQVPESVDRLLYGEINIPIGPLFAEPSEDRV